MSSPKPALSTMNSASSRSGSSTTPNSTGDFMAPQLPKRARITSSSPRGGSNNLTTPLLSRLSHAGDQTRGQATDDDEMALQAFLANRRETTLSIFGPDVQCLPCTCRVPSEVRITDDLPETCQGLDTVNNAYVECNGPLSPNMVTFVRAHVRDRLKVLCDNHLLRLRLHQCCPGCGMFCLQGQFNKCHESDPPHYFHLTCVNELGQCPHCLSPNFEPVNADLTVLQLTDLSSHRGRMTTPITWSEGIRRLLNMPTDTIIRRHTHRLPGTEKDICTADLADVGDREAIRKAISSVDPNVVASAENLEEAMNQGDLRLVLSILAKKMDVNMHLSSGLTLLQHAAANGLVYIAYVLISLGVDVDAEDSEGRTALMLAAAAGNYPMCNILMRYGLADILHKDKSMDTSLHLAAKTGAVEIVRLLLYGSSRIATVDEQDLGGWTPLMWASETGQVDTVDVLLHAGARVSIMDSEGNIALHWAAMSGSVDVGRMLLQNKNKDYVNKQNGLGYTPLMIACRENHIPFMELLIANGADPRIEDGDHKTAETYLRLHVQSDDDPKILILQAAEKTVAIREIALRRKRGMIKADLSNGKERVRISVYNDEDDANVDDLVYVTKLIETSIDTRVDWHILPEVCTCKCPSDCSLTATNPEDGCLCLPDGRIWYDENGRLAIDFPFATANQPACLFECNILCRCSMTCKNRVVQRGITVALKLVRTSDKGWGVFADEDIPKGSFVCEYAGELITDEEADLRHEDTYLFELADSAYTAINANEKTLCVDANKFGNVSRYINHGCESNLIPIKIFYDHFDVKAPHVGFFAYKDIRKNDELTFDYGPKFWAVKGQQISCKCRSPRCQYSSEKIKGFMQTYAKQLQKTATRGF